MARSQCKPGYEHSYFYRPPSWKTSLTFQAPEALVSDDRTFILDAMPAPSRKEAERVRSRHKIKMFVVSNGRAAALAKPYVETVIVPDGLSGRYVDRGSGAGGAAMSW